MTFLNFAHFFRFWFKKLANILILWALASFFAFNRIDFLFLENFFV